MKTLVEMFISWLFRIIGWFHCPNLIYFESFHGKQFSDNPKAIYQFMKDEYPEYKLVWGVSKGYEKPFQREEVSYVPRFSLKWFFIMPRAEAWVVNTRTPLWLTKNKKTTYVQTWHGTPLKKIGIDIPDVKIPGYTQASYTAEFKDETSRWDYLVSPSSYCTEVFRQAFAYNGKVLEYGYPRNDVLVEASKNKKVTIKDSLAISKGKKVVLYAPTWRETDERKNGAYQFSTPFPYKKIVEAFGTDIILLVRMHYLVAQTIDFTEFDGGIVDVSTYPDMSDLLLISDLLITDYSSCMFDYALTNNPILYFIPDKEAYETELRGFYFDMASLLPGKMVETETDLVQQLHQFIESQEQVKTSHYATFKDTFCSLEQGEAAKKVAEAISHS